MLGSLTSGGSDSTRAWNAQCWRSDAVTGGDSAS